jgi:hypothetical protein
MAEEPMEIPPEKLEVELMYCGGNIKPHLRHFPIKKTQCADWPEEA